MSVSRSDNLVAPKIIPERIREAREGCGLTAEDFAESLGVSKQAVGQYEIGQSSPSALVMSAIIALTGQPPAFFTASRMRPAGEFGTPFWRGLKRMNRPDRLRVGRRLEWACDIVNFVENFIDLPALNIPPIEWNFDEGGEEDSERIAASVRDHWGLGRGPIYHVSAVLESHGFIVLKERVNCEDMDAVSRWQGGRPFILCSADKDHLPRKNFDLAHELGHMLLHHGIETTKENLSKLERQANYFAGAFLLPRETFSREVVSTSIHYFLKLKEHWRVSVQAMVYRCKELGILNERKVEYLWRQMSARGMRKEEPLDALFGTETPTVLVSALNMLVEHGVQSRAEIRDALNLNASDIESLCGAESGFLGETVVPLQFRKHN